MNLETQNAVREFCQLFPNVKSTVDNANDLQRVTKIGYYVYRHSDDIDEVKNYIREHLNNDSKDSIANEVETELKSIRSVLVNLDSLHFLN